MASLRFYSKQEITTLKSAINSGEKLTKAADRLSKELKRPKNSVYFKLLETAKRMGVMKTKTKKTAKVVTQSNEGVTLRNGFVFDFKPQRAEMYQDHVRIYF